MSENDKKPDSKAPGRPVSFGGRIDEQTAEGTYSSIASIMFSRSEFHIDFGRLVPGRRETKVRARIITSPLHTKDLARLPARNIRQFEEESGPIAAAAEGRKVGF